MPLSVIGAGQGRTGTMSLKLALEQLGFGPCHHMSEVVINPPSAAAWIRAAEGHPDWEAIFEGYASGVDAPTCFFWRDLAKAYPDARIILTVRDPDAWFDSGQATVMAPRAQTSLASSPLGEFFMKVMPRAFGARDPESMHDRAFMTAYFKRHNAEVVSEVPKDRLLVYEVSQGWAPLCAFLGVPVPDEPFPRANTREEMSAMMAAAGADRGAGLALDRVQENLRSRLGKN